MPEYIKNSTLEEIKESYGSNHGFVFLSNMDLSEREIESMAETLKTQAISKDYPVLAAKIGNGVFFVYDEFDGPKFFFLADKFNMFGIARIEPLLLFLKNH